MPKIKYEDKNIRKSGLDTISQVNDVIDSYEEQGYTLTLRQVYYQLVSKNLIKNSENSYDNLGVLIKNGRLAGLIDWDAIEDRTRFVRELSHWDSPKDIIESAAASYRIDLWQDQDCYVEVWVEKDVLVGIIEQVANKYDVPCFSCRGYGSTSEYWRAAQRIIENNQLKKDCIILHLGDHDPSGVDMTRDITARLATFGARVHIERIALNMPQIEEYNPPPQPAKKTDSRANKYIDSYGANSWELDALEPKMLDDLISNNILKYIDVDKFEKLKIRQDEEKQKILRATIGG